MEVDYHVRELRPGWIVIPTADPAGTRHFDSEMAALREALKLAAESNGKVFIYDAAGEVRTVYSSL